MIRFPFTYICTYFFILHCVNHGLFLIVIVVPYFWGIFFQFIRTILHFLDPLPISQQVEIVAYVPHRHNDALFVLNIHITFEIIKSMDAYLRYPMKPPIYICGKWLQTTL